MKKMIVLCFVLSLMSLYLISCNFDVSHIDTTSEEPSNEQEISGDTQSDSDVSQNVKEPIYLNKINLGMTRDDILGVLPEDSVLRFGNYLFFRDESQSVVLFFNENRILERIESYPQRISSLEDTDSITEQTTIYAMVEMFGVPTYFGGGGFDFLEFQCGSTSFVTPWGNMSKDNATMAYNPFDYIPPN